MNLLSNPTYLLPPLIVFASGIVLIAIVLIQAKKMTLRRIFVWLLLSVAISGLIIYGMRASPNVEMALPWDRASFVSAFAVFVLYYHFTRACTGTRKKPGLLYAAYSLLFVGIGLAPTGLIVERMTVESYGYAPVTGPLTVVLAVVGFLLVIFGIRNLSRRYRSSLSQIERNRLTYLIIGAIVIIVGAMLDAFSPLPPVAIWTALFFCIVATIVIVKYHLLDIRILIKKGLAYIIISFIIAAPYVVALFFLSRSTQSLTERWWLHLIVIISMSVLLRPLYGWAQRRVDRLFYRDRYDYFKALEQLAKEAHSITDSKSLAQKVVELTNSALRNSSVSLLLLSQESNSFVRIAAVGLDSPSGGVVLNRQSSLIKWMEIHKRAINTKELDINIELQSLSRDEKNNLGKLQAELYVPVRSRDGKLCGVITLGKKLSQQIYSEDEIRLVSAVADHLSINLENSWLYEEMKRSAEALRQNERKLHLTLESMSEGIVVIDLEGEILQVNQALIQMCGRDSQKEFVGQNVFNFLSPRYKTGYEQMFREALQGKTAKGYIECTAMKKGGIEFDIEVSSNIFSYKNGSPNGFVAIIKDISERKRLEKERKELELRAQMASRLASVGEMASGIAHEINNPLTSVIGFSQILMRKDIPDNLRKYAENINEGSQRVATIVKRLLTFARQYKPERRQIDINDLMKNTIELRAHAIQTSNIQLLTNLANNLPTTIADPGQLQQVFLNIIINAETEMKLANHGGTLWITTEQIDGFIRVIFKDDGPGISKENLEKIFDPFFTTREVGQGTGLGLSLSHSIIDEHKGRITAESNLGEGATFTVEIPIVCKKGKPEAAELLIELPKSRVEPDILVVDDEPTVLSYLEEVLSDENWRVDTVDNGNDALKLISKRKKYDAILLDVKLPGIGGIDCYMEIKKYNEDLAKRVIFITGDVMAIETRNFLLKTEVKYVTKPFDINQLKKEIAAILVD